MTNKPRLNQDIDQKLKELYEYLNSGMGATEYDFIFHAKVIIQDLLDEQREQGVAEVISQVFERNHDKELGTYDYDGIVEDLIDQLQQKEEAKYKAEYGFKVFNDIRCVHCSCKKELCCICNKPKEKSK